MKPATHLIDPVRGKRMGPEFITLRCGRVTNSEKIKTTANPAEVTCIKCKSYINNPWRVLRKYGKVKVVENEFVVIWGDYGYKIDMVAILHYPGWEVRMSYKNKPLNGRYISVSDMAQLGFKMQEIIEEMIINISAASKQ